MSTLELDVTEIGEVVGKLAVGTPVSDAVYEETTLDDFRDGVLLSPADTQARKGVVVEPTAEELAEAEAELYDDGGDGSTHDLYAVVEWSDGKREWQDVGMVIRYRLPTE